MLLTLSSRFFKWLDEVPISFRTGIGSKECTLGGFQQESCCGDRGRGAIEADVQGKAGRRAAPKDLHGTS